MADNTYSSGQVAVGAGQLKKIFGAASLPTVNW
jgi:hypothetical protein